MLPEAGDRAWRLAGVAALSVAGLFLLALLSLAGLAPMLRALAALVLVVLPGYLVAWPIVRQRFGAAGAFTVAGGLSIGMTVMAGLVLNLLPWGLQAATWLAYIIVVLGVALVLDRRRMAWRPRLPVVRHEVVLGGIGATMLVASLLVARIFVADSSESFTQLWIAPSSAAPTTSVDVSIRNEERVATGYALEVRRDGALVQAWPEIRLAAGQTWRSTVAVGSGRIEARLFRLSDPGTLYRHVTLLLVAASQDALRQPA